MAACAHPSEAPPPAQPTQFPQPATTGPSPREAPRESGQVGYATWYGARFAGRKTADGERFDPNLMTAAHRTLPFGTWVKVQRVDTGESVRVRITDRGPWGHADRIIDLSRAAAKALHIMGEGLTKVRLSVVAGP
jgi:rare lipoprotein A